jgi:hypothetical protein
MILWQLQRKHDDPADDYAANARLLELDFHFKMGKFGTHEMIPV